MTHSCALIIFLEFHLKRGRDGCVMDNKAVLKVSNCQNLNLK